MTPAEADKVLAKNQIRKVDAFKGTVTYHDSAAPGHPQVGVSVTQNGQITAVIKNIAKDKILPTD